MSTPPEPNAAAAPPPEVPSSSKRPVKAAAAKLAKTAESRFAVPMLGLLSFLDACVSPILPEVILVPLCLRHPARRWIYAMWASVTSVLGAVCGYYLGFGLWENGLREIAYEWVPGFDAEVFASVAERYGSAAFGWVVVAALTPLPFKVFTVVAGVCHEQVSITALVMGSIVGRFPRFFLEVALIHRLGPQFLIVIRKQLWAVLAITAIVITLWIWLG